MTPVANQPDAKININGNMVVSGRPSPPLPFWPGINTVNIIVTAQNGNTVTYTVTITRALNDDSTLFNLTVSDGTLNPSFSPTTTTYSVDVENSVSSLTVTPTMSLASATVNGENVQSQQASTPIPLSVGDNTINVVVTAQDGIATTTYTIVVRRDITTGINDNLDTKYYFYPNPAQNQITFTETGELNVSICNMFGIVLTNKKVSGSLSVANLSKGLYFLKFEKNGISHTEKLIKN
jgi:hypothetical protein